MATAKELAEMTRELVKAGKAPTFHEHAKPKQGPPTPTEKPTPLPTLVCTQLGAREGGTCNLPVYNCNLKGGTTTLFVKCPDADFHCETCREDTRKANPPTSKPLPQSPPKATKNAKRNPVQLERPPAEPGAPVFSPIGRRHLAFMLLPVAGNGVWQEAIDRLRSHWHLFTGRKVFAVATGKSVAEQIDKQEGPGPAARVLPIDTFDTVRRYLPSDAEAFQLANAPDRWESAAWYELFGRILPAADDADAVLYAHAKGVTRRPASPAHRWADMLYTLSLDAWPVVAELLRRKPIVGSLIRSGAFFSGKASASKWHYSGNFWWVRADHLRKGLKAHAVPRDRWGAEAWPGIAFPIEDAGSVFTPSRDFHLYNPDDLGRVLVEYSAFLSSFSRRLSLVAMPEKKPLREKREDTPPRLSVVVATTGRGSLARTLESVRPQLKAGDELIVKFDQSGDWGATPRTEGMHAATGTHVLWMDDDDIYLPGALDTVRRALSENPGRPHLFRLWREGGHGDELPRSEEVKVGNVSTQMCVFPNDPDRFGRWGTHYEGDFDFVASTLSNYPAGAVVFRPEILSVWRPPEDGIIYPKPWPNWWSYEAGSFDEPAFWETVCRDDYRLKSVELVGQTCLDVGAHVGSFAYAAKARGAAVVHCYEPQPTSFAHLNANAEKLRGVVAFRAAVGPIVEDMLQPGRPNPDNADVTTCLLDDAVEAAAGVSPTGRVRVLKLDAEGAEWANLDGFTRWDLVDYIRGEWHEVSGMTAGSGPAALAETFGRRGWGVECVPTADRRGLFFATRSS